MKIFNKEGLIQLRKLYQEMLKKRASDIAPYVTLRCFVETSNPNRLEFSFEFQVSDKKPCPEGIYTTAGSLMTRLKLRKEERELAEKFGIKIKTRRVAIDTSFFYGKYCLIPKKVLPLELRRWRALHEARVEKIGNAGTLFEKISKTVDDVYAGSQETNMLILEATKLYFSAKPESLLSDRRSYKKAVVGFFGMKDLEFND